MYNLFCGSGKPTLFRASKNLTFPSPLLQERLSFAVGVGWCFFNDSSVSRPHCFAGYIKGYPIIVGVSGIDSVGMLSAFQSELGNTYLGTTSIANRTLSCVYFLSSGFFHYLRS